MASSPCSRKPRLMLGRSCVATFIKVSLRALAALDLKPAGGLPANDCAVGVVLASSQLGGHRGVMIIDPHLGHCDSWFQLDDPSVCCPGCTIKRQGSRTGFPLRRFSRALARVQRLKFRLDRAAQLLFFQAGTAHQLRKSLGLPNSSRGPLTSSAPCSSIWAFLFVQLAQLQA